jgi:hypothetical protein
MSYWMYALREDGSVIEHKGDSGPISAAHEVDALTNKFTGVVKQQAEPEVGCCMQVGSFYARSYSAQDWWMTTPVTEIVSRIALPDSSLVVIFKTKNSTYKWRYHG